MEALLPWLLVVAPPAVPASIGLLNLLSWPRGRGGHRSELTVSVLIPARNEEERIEACVRAALRSHHPVGEVVVYDDVSTDATGAILERLAAEDSRLRVVKGVGLPAGWVGKPHACHQLGRHAKGEVLFFIDADTVLEPEGVSRALSLLEQQDPFGHPTDLVTAVPRQDTGTLAERWLLPLLHLTYVAWLPLLLVRLSQDPRLLAANGQVLAVRRGAYERAGGFEFVRNEVVDDMAFCARVKETGGRVWFADGFAMARCRMYTSGREVWEGFSKNLYEGVGEHPLALGMVGLLYGGAFVLPYLALALALSGLLAPTWLLAAAVGVGLNLLVRLALALRFGHRLDSVLVHPLAVLGLLGIAVNSWAWSRRGAIHWRGRVYAARAARSGASK